MPRPSLSNDSLPPEGCGRIQSVIRFHFGHEDLVRTRFAISPLFDLTWSTDVLRDPAAHSLHLPWAARRSAAPGGLRLRAFGPARSIFVAAAGYVPDFLASAPHDAARPNSTTSSLACGPRPPSVSRVGLGWRFQEARALRPPRGRSSMTPRGPAELTTVMAAYFKRAIAPLAAGDRHRAREHIRDRRARLAAEARSGLRGSLPTRCAGARALEVERRYEQDVGPRGRGLLLVPPRSRGRGCSR